MKGSDQIKREMTRLTNLLLSKNAAYGDSALKYGTVFPIDPETAIKSRINDKLARIMNKGIDDNTEDTIDDLIGYLVLLNISRIGCVCGKKLTEPNATCTASIHGYDE